MAGGVGRVEILVSGRRKLPEPHFNLGRATRRNIDVIKTPLTGIDAVDGRSGSAFSGLHPGWRDIVVPNTVAIQILERLTGVPRAVAICISERFKTRAISALYTSLDVIVRRVAIIDVIPDLGHTGIGADHNTIARAADG